MATSIRSTVFDVLKWRKSSAVLSRSIVEEPTQGITEPSENEPQNDEYKLPGMTSMAIVVLTNTLLQVSVDLLVMVSESVTHRLLIRYRSLSSFPRLICMQSILAGVRYFPVLLSEFLDYFPALRLFHLQNSTKGSPLFIVCMLNSQGFRWI